MKKSSKEAFLGLLECGTSRPEEIPADDYVVAIDATRYLSLGPSLDELGCGMVLI